MTFCKPGGKDCVNFSAFSESRTTKVYNRREHRILNLVWASRFRILTNLASGRRAFCKKSRMSVICFGMVFSVDLGRYVKTNWNPETNERDTAKQQHAIGRPKQMRRRVFESVAQQVHLILSPSTNDALSPPLPFSKSNQTTYNTTTTRLFSPRSFSRLLHPSS